MQKGLGFVREYNVEQKFGSDVSLYVATIFPNIYTAGMSSYTIHLLHHLLNLRPEILCDRFFYPMEISEQAGLIQPKKHHSQKQITPRLPIQQKIRSFGHNLPITDFDVLCFTLQYELDYPKVLFFLQQAGIPLFTDQRITASDLKQGYTRYPLVIAGGPCARSNPLPMAPFIDFFYTGDFEAIMEPFLDDLIKYRKNEKETMFDTALISKFLKLPGFWTFNRNICQNADYDSKFKVIYDTLTIYSPKTFIDHLINPSKGLFAETEIYIPLAHDIDQLSHPTRQIIVEFSDPNIELAFGKSIFIEIGRGCPHGCKFCMTGAHGKPVRFRSIENIKEIIQRAVSQMQIKKITLIAPSIIDHPKINELLIWMNSQGLEYSLPSVRIEKMSEELLEIIKNSGIRTVTIAPETGTDLLRQKISKPIKNQTIVDNCKKLKEIGIKNIKMYFIIGLPDESDDDIKGIVDLVSEIAKLGFDRGALRCSINYFVPKANTPFEQATHNYVKFHEKKSDLSKKMKRIIEELAPIPQVEIEHENFFDSYLQTLFSIGDIKMSELIMLCFLNNVSSFSGFKRLINEHKLSFNLDEYLQSIKLVQKGYLPWKFIRCY